MSNTTTRNDVKQIAEKIELLAKEVQAKLDSGGDFLSPANELSRNNLTFVFTLGEFYALQQSGTGKSVKAVAVSNPNGTSSWYNVRDSRGRFAKKI